MAIENLELGKIECRSSADLMLEAHIPDPPHLADLEVHTGGIVTEPYLVVKGFPVPDEGFGASVATRVGATITEKIARPTQHTAQPGSLFRWQVHPNSFVTMDDGNITWIPRGGSVTGYGRVLFKTYAPHGDPKPDYAFSYASATGRRSEPALSFRGKGCGFLHVVPEGQVRQGGATFMLTAVMRTNALPEYGIFEANQENKVSGGEPLVIKYNHGALGINQAARRVITHQVRAAVNEPMVFLLSLDADTDTGRLVVIDSTRATRTFTARGLDFISFYGILGALGQPDTYTHRADMDVLEMNYWDRALGDAEALAQASLQALMYGVAG